MGKLTAAECHICRAHRERYGRLGPHELRSRDAYWYVGKIEQRKFQSGSWGTFCHDCSLECLLLVLFPVNSALFLKSLRVDGRRARDVGSGAGA
jgi:hypothetical protein